MKKPDSVAPNSETLDLEEMRYAGFWVRALTTIIDIFFIIIFLSIIVSIFAMTAEYIPGELKAMELILQVIIVCVSLMMWIKWGATPGKMLKKIVIVDEKTGGKLSLKQCFIRYLAQIPSTLVFGLGYLWIAIDDKKRGWHDILSGTVVIYRNKQDSAFEAKQVNEK
jgi:uncharacterized RDD family membrane protein YckC